MIDLFGRKIDTMNKKPKSRYQRFKLYNHYRKSFNEKNCGNCKHSQQWLHHDKQYWKCTLLGVSHSETTDIRKHWICDKFSQ